MNIDMNKQRGAVSLFVVVFAALLITIVTVSFVRIMIQDQQQASTTDISQSAYDSAQAGIEDAKRALLRLQNICGSGDSDACAKAQSKIDSKTCNDAVKTLSEYASIPAGGEIKVQTASSTNSMDQAYTCVKIIMQTSDYIGVLDQDASKFIPLVGATNFDTIKIEWFSPKDLQVSTTKANIPAFTAATPPLLSQDSWTSSTLPNRPSIMRAQLMQFNNMGFSLSDFEGGASINGSNNTLFLYPSNIAETTKSFISDTRKTAKIGVPTQVTCNDLGAAQEYACSATIKLPVAVANNDHTQYLNLASLYKKAHYRVTLWNSSNQTPVKFDGVQPEIDSTGRTSDLFRRVEVRVELTDVNFPYPEATVVETKGKFCKDFNVTDSVNDYQNKCTP